MKGRGVDVPAVARRWAQAPRTYFFLLVAALLVVITLFYYLTPQARPLPFVDASLSRHTLERVLFILPVAIASFAFGQPGGIAVLVVSFLLMLPRAVCISPRPVDAVVETVIVTAAGYLVVWIVGARKQEELLRQEALAQLQALNAVNDIVTGSMDLEQVLRDALDKVLEVTGLEVGLVFFLDQQAGELVLAAFRGVTEESAAEVDRLSLGEGFCGRVARCGELMVVEDSSQDPRLTRLAVREEGVRSQVIVPMKSKGKVRGVLALGTRRLRRFSSQDLELVTAIGNHIGVAIENIQLHQDVARQLRTQVRLAQVAEEITSELELERVMPRVLQMAEELVGADAGVIALLDRESGCIRYPYVHNLPPEVADTVVPEGEGLAGEVIQNGRPVVVADYRTYSGAVPAFVAAGMTSVVAAPIISGAKVFGMLAVGTVEGTEVFSDWDAAMLSSVGRQAGIALENARLYEGMRFYASQVTVAREEERKRIAQELHDGTVQMLIAISRRLEALASPRRQLPEHVARSLGELQKMTGQVISDTRLFIQGLRPPALDHLGLVPAITGLVDSLKERGAEVEFEVRGEARRLTPYEELALFRIAQEALNNAWRHSDASRVRVQLVFGADKVRLNVQDNGSGFEVPEQVEDLVAKGRLGLIGMRERARALGGVVQVQSAPGKGTTVVVDVPMRMERGGGGI